MFMPVLSSKLRIAVVTPHATETVAELERCHRSVRAQEDVIATHILVGDGPRGAALCFGDAICYVLSSATCDYGETPRLAGWDIAIDEGFDAIAYLDADNWFYSGHLGALARLLEREGAEIAISNRMLHHIDGWPMSQCLQSDGIAFCDTNCMMFRLPNALRWREVIAEIEPRFKPIHDRILWHSIRRSDARIARSGRSSVAYVSKVPEHYRTLALPVPPGLEGRGTAINLALDLWEALGQPSLRFAHVPRLSADRPITQLARGWN